MTNSSVAELAKLRVEYDNARSLLMDERLASRRQRALAFWSLPSDRRLPFALIERTLDELLRQPFEVHAATPRIGVRKLRMFITLLQRAAVEEPVSRPSIIFPEPISPSPVSGELDPGKVSEQHWAQWCETIRRHELQDELLGRLAASLQMIPTVIWRTPVRAYLGESLQSIWALPTHGQKRVGAVLQVIYSTHVLLNGAGSAGTFRVRIAPRFTVDVEHWLWQSDIRDDAVSHAEVRQMLALPMLNQIQHDAGQLLHDLVADRLGIEAHPKTVREQADQFGLTRSRIYQLYNLCEEVMRLRWPTGGLMLRHFGDAFRRRGAETGAVQLVNHLRDLFYPQRDGRAAGETIKTSDDLALEPAMPLAGQTLPDAHPADALLDAEALPDVDTLLNVDTIKSGGIRAGTHEHVSLPNRIVIQGEIVMSNELVLPDSPVLADNSVLPDRSVFPGGTPEEPIGDS